MASVVGGAGWIASGTTLKISMVFQGFLLYNVKAITTVKKNILQAKNKSAGREQNKFQAQPRKRPKRAISLGGTNVHKDRFFRISFVQYVHVSQLVGR
jgi:uncharacterized membrane protein